MARSNPRDGGVCGSVRWRYALLALALLGLLPAAPARGGDEAPGAYAWRLGLKQGLGVRGISCLRIHPREEGVLWAYVHGIGPARSEDGGRTWAPSLKGIDEKLRPGVRSQVRITLDPREPKVAYVVIDGQIFRSEDGGLEWTSVTSGALASLSLDKLKSTHLSWEVRVDTRQGNHLLVGTHNDGFHNGGLYESMNGGKSWEEIAGTAQPKSHLGADTFFVRADPKTDKAVTVAGRSAVWYSDDRGRTFKRNDPGGEGLRDIRNVSELTGRELYLADARGVWRSRDAGKSWEKKPLREGDALSVYPDLHKGNRVYAIFHDIGLVVSDDARNAKWTSTGGRFAAPAGADPEPEAGYRRAEPREICVHPRDRKLVYLASPVTGLHESTDGGETFHPVEPPADHDPTSPLKVIPQTTAAMALVAVHPVYGGSHLAISAEGVVYRSADRGESWQAVGRLGEAPGLLQADPAAGTWWAAGRTLLRSTDDGATWGQVFPRAGAHPAADAEARIVALRRGPAADGAVAPLHLVYDREGVVWTSPDGGATWKASKAPKTVTDGGGTWAADLAVDAADGQHMVMATRTTLETWSTKDENGGVFETWDGGSIWNDVTGNLAPTKKDAPEVRRTKACWNRGRFVAFDQGAGLMVYGADRCGVFARPWLDEKGKKPSGPATWARVGPAGHDGATLLAALHAAAPDGKDTRWVLQVQATDGTAGCWQIASATLRALHEHTTAETPEGEAPAWSEMASPGTGEVLTGLAADPQLPGRLLAADADGEHGIVVFEIPGSKPKAPARDEPKKEEPKKDEPKKEEPGKGEPTPGGGNETTAPTARPPEGMRAFSVGADQALRVWAVDEGTADAPVPGHEGAATCVALTPDETHILSGGDDRTLRLWSPVGAKAEGSVMLAGVPRAVVVDEDSAFAYVALDGDGGLVQVGLADLSVKAFPGHEGAVTCVAVSDDPNRAYSAGADKAVRIWDTRKGAEVNSISLDAAPTALAVAAGGMHVYVATADGSVAQFDVAGKPVRTLVKLPAPATALTPGPDGKRLYAATQDGVAAIDTETMTLAHLLAAPGAGALTCLALSADGVWILAGDAQGGLWTWLRDRPEAWRPRVQGHEGAMRGLCVTREETALAAPPPGSGGPATEPKGDAPKDGAPKDDAPKDDAPKDDSAKGAPPKDAGAPPPPAEPVPPETPGK